MKNSGDRLSIEQADPREEPVIALGRALLAEEAVLYADLGPDTLESFQSGDVLAGRGVMLLARLDGEPVGCGALRPMDADTAEIKRMYVVPTARRRGVARAILGELERRAAEFRYRLLRLETGNRQVEAISLYEGCGFSRVPPFGAHAHDPVSVFFEKVVSGGAAGNRAVL